MVGLLLKVCRLGLLLPLVAGACRKSDSDVESSSSSTPRIDSATPSGTVERDGGSGISDDDAALVLDEDPGVTDVIVSVPDRADDIGIGLALNGKWKPSGGDFGSVMVGRESEPQIFTFTNTGTQPTGTLMTQLGGSDSTSFLVVEDKCRGANVAPGEGCAVTVRFKPTKTGELFASVTIIGPAKATAALIVGGTGIGP
ncbi:MAG TPA: choice-of-anchor D domain-containing protein [Polyangia bacterium]|nr:choice-of-anchor D domain-containing protein [Polyangia bacterium]